MRTLRASGEEVVGLDVEPSPFTSEVGSILDPACVRHAIAAARIVYHTATLHKPHIDTHGMQQFIDTNVTGTLTLLQAASDEGVEAFVFTSTTSAFGDALRPPASEPAVWVTEEVAPIPRNIYGVSKLAAEDLCVLFHRKQGLNCVILRTSRFFPEEDDDAARRSGFTDGNLKANEYLYRRVELEDVVDAHLLAGTRATQLKFGRYIVSATTPFRQEDLAELRVDAPGVLQRRVPEYVDLFERLGWRMFDGIDRVYVNNAARRDLQWNPKFDFRYVLSCLRQESDPRSSIARLVGSKGYHNRGDG